MLDPKVLLLLATGTLLLLNGLLARSSAAKRPESNGVADAQGEEAQKREA